MDEPLVIRYTPEKDDYLRASRALAFKSTVFKILAGVILFAMLGALIVLLVPGIGNPTWENIALIFLIVGVFYVVYYLVIIPFQFSRAFKKNVFLQQERTYTFTDEAIHLQIGENETDMDWENIQKAVHSKDFYLLINTVEGQGYPIIPKRAFDQAQTQENFVKLLASKSIPIT